jgi:hypothetical protein
MLFATIGTQDDAELVTVLLQIVLRDLLIPCLDVSRLDDITQPPEKCLITKQRSDRLREAQDLLGIHFYSRGFGTKLAAGSNTALPTKESANQVALALDSGLAERFSKLGCVASEKGLIRGAEGSRDGCQLFDGRAGLLQHRCVQLLFGFVTHEVLLLAAAGSGGILGQNLRFIDNCNRNIRKNRSKGAASAV